MNLHAAVRGAVTTVNPDIQATWQQSTGYSTDGGGKRTPGYANSTIPIQVQALTAQDLTHLDYLNIQGVMRAVYAYGNIQGVVRPNLKGGDLLTFAQPGGVPQIWLVVAVLETWPDWCKVAVCLQNDAVFDARPMTISTAAGTLSV